MTYTNLNNPFYNDISDSVKKELDARASLYGTQNRGGTSGDKVHDWLYGKTAYVRVRFNDGKSDKVVLEPPLEGFKTMYGKDLYPKPLITAVNISNEGDYCSLMKADIHFTVFTLAQLEEFLGTLLFVQGQKDGKQPVSIDYGWTIGGHDGRDGMEETLTGSVYNFDWTLRADGGFDCVSKVIAAGFFSINTNSDATSPLTTKTTAGDIETKAYSWIDTISILPFGGKYVLAGFEKFVLPGKRAGIALIERPIRDKSKPEDAQNAPSGNYVTLEWICMAVSKTITLNSENYRRDDAYPLFIADKESTLGWTYNQIYIITSADPKNILLPGVSEYNGVDLTEKVEKDITVLINNSSGTHDLSKILISVTFLQSVLESQRSTLSMRMNGKGVDKSVITFFNTIFEKISFATGGIYNLALCAPSVPDDKSADYKHSQDTWIVYDTGYIPGLNSKKEPLNGDKVYTIPVISAKPNTSNGICRTVAIQSNLPGAMATAQYISAAATLTGLRNVSIGNVVSTTREDYDFNAALDAAKESIIKLKKALGANGFIQDDVDKLAAALREYKMLLMNSKDPGTAKCFTGAPIPVTLSITMDGIKGFRAGNVFTISYLPKAYKDIVFTVTKIQHTIQNNDWTTTLTTVCRLKV